MTRSRALLVPVLLLCALLGGCGGSGGSGDSSDAPADRPDDFAISFHHSDGSVAPPYHAEYTIEVDSDGSGRATYWPDYPGKGVPAYKSTFTLDDSELDDLYGEVRDAGLLTDIEESDDPPIGGSVETAEITADGETYEVPGFAADGSSPASAISGQMVGLVPTADWDSFQKRREAYAKSEYGQAPQ